MSAELQVLREQGWFKSYLISLAKEAPRIRAHDPNDPHCVEKWKADCHRREGYFNALSRFGHKLEDLQGDN